MKALVKWSVFATATGRPITPYVDPAPWFTIADRDDLSYGDKLAAYRAMADHYFDTERYLDFCASRLGDIDEIVLEYIESADFDRVLVETVTTTFPPHEHEQFVAHYRGLLGAWATDERRQLG
jgi:hypothetical protein